MTAQKKLLIYKILLFVFAFFLAFMPSTAMRNREVNSRVIVEMLGLDGDGAELSLTAQYVVPSESEGSTTRNTVTVKGKALSDAVESLNTALGRRAELGHCSIVIVGSELDTEVLATLMTATAVTADAWLSAAEDKAEDLVGDITEYMKKTGALGAEFIAYSARKEQIATNTLLGFLSDLGSASETAYIPLVEIEKESGGGDKGEGGGSGSESGSSEESGGESGSSAGGGKGEEKSHMKVERLAIYGKRGRLGIMDADPSRGVAWVSAPIEKGTVCADVDYGGKEHTTVCGRLLEKHSSIKTDARSKTATVKIKAFIEPYGDKFNALYASNDDKARAALVEGYKAKIEEDVMSAYSESLRLGGDPLFIGREFYRYSPEYYETYYIYNDVTVKCDIDIALK